MGRKGPGARSARTALQKGGLTCAGKARRDRLRGPCPYNGPGLQTNSSSVRPIAAKGAARRSRGTKRSSAAFPWANSSRERRARDFLVAVNRTAHERANSTNSPRRSAAADLPGSADDDPSYPKNPSTPQKNRRAADREGLILRALQARPPRLSGLSGAPTFPSTTDALAESAPSARREITDEGRSLPRSTSSATFTRLCRSSTSRSTRALYPGLGSCTIEAQPAHQTKRIARHAGPSRAVGIRCRTRRRCRATSKAALWTLEQNAERGNLRHALRVTPCSRGPGRARVS